MKRTDPNCASLPFTPTTSVAELMHDWPETIPVFLKFHMACVGCGMAAFEPLVDAARIYGIPAEQLYESLTESITSAR